MLITKLKSWFRRLDRMLFPWRWRAHGTGLRSLLYNSRLFNPEFYRSAYRDVDLSGLSPLEHFIEIGLHQGRYPSVGFDPHAYARSNADVQGPPAALVHYLTIGQIEGRALAPIPFPPDEFNQVRALVGSSGLFDATYYATAHPALQGEQMDPLIHYLVSGYRSHIEPSNKVSMRAYIARYADVRDAGINPLFHWLKYGVEEDRICESAASPSWCDYGRASPLPDDVVQFERMEGEAYFARMGFRFSERQPTGNFDPAIALMRIRKPELLIDYSAPKVSIIVPVFGQVHFVLNCLDSLAHQTSEHTVEIIVADDASPKGSSSELLQQIPWIRYLRRPENGGFLECCNWAAQLANGEFIVLLNSDTRVVKGWLDELIRGFELHPRAGLVGSKLFNDDATLQEAGGIFWRDGSAQNYGRNKDSNHPLYCFARQVDFISGASIALRRDAWRQMRGFDPHFKPAYCEDADLAFRLRAVGYEVWYLPYSRVIHYEGVTHGRDTTKGVKAYQVENLRKFAYRHKEILMEHPAPGVVAELAAFWRERKRMLVVDALPPKPDQDSGSIVTDEVMRTYRSQGFKINFFPAHSPLWDARYMADLQRNGICCHYWPYTHDIEGILSYLPELDYALLYRHNVARPILGEIRRKSPATRILFANVDLHYLREARAASTLPSCSGYISAELTKTHELEVFARADAAFVHTEFELNLIKASLPGMRPNILVLPWITDLQKSEVDFDHRRDVMFLGNFPHVPNIDSVKYFHCEIWPLLEKALPVDARLLIVGNKPPPEVIAMKSERVVVTGFVEDLAPYFSSSRVFVAPLRFGAGIKGKLVTSLAHGVPSVASSIAAEGIGAQPCNHLAIEDDPIRFAARVLQIYRDRGVWTELRDAGIAFVRENYSRDAANFLCERALEIADETWLARQEARRNALLESILREAGEALGDQEHRLRQ